MDQINVTPSQRETPVKLVSLILPAYNEAEVLEWNLSQLYHYMTTLDCVDDWEMIIINDGSRDSTGAIAELFAAQHNTATVIHHPFNLGLGGALKSGFAVARGDCVITLDIDLSYSPSHIEALILAYNQSGADIVLTSPYMKGGKVTNVPWLRYQLSVWANRFLGVATKRDLSTITGMVRAYNPQFLDDLRLKSNGMDINPEIIHKARLLGARIHEIPAHLHWPQPSRTSIQGGKIQRRRQSSMKIMQHTWAILFYGFMFRPVMFFIVPSGLFFLLSLYSNIWVLIHCWTNFLRLIETGAPPNVTVAVAQAFQQSPHAFIIGGMSLILATQFLSLGILAIQNQRYFEEIFYLTSSRKSQRD